MPLVSVKSLFHGDLGVIRVGDRHEYVFDWDPDGADYEFWIASPRGGAPAALVRETRVY